MCFWAALVIRNAPRRCTPRTISQSSSLILNSRLSRSTPALLTSTVGGPSSATTWSTAAATWSAWLTSAPTAIARPPSDTIVSTTALPSSALRSSTATAIPSAARRWAVPAPIPRAPPVTMAILCASCGIVRSPCYLSSAGAADPARPGELAQTLANAHFPVPRPVIHFPSSPDRDLRPVFSGHPVRAKFPAGQGALVHLVGAICEAEGAGVCPQVREREILADPGRAVRRDRLVDHPLGHGRGDDLDGLDLGVRTLVAHRVHQPGGLQHQQPGLLDPDPRLGDPLLDHPLLRQRLAEGDPVGDPAAEQL